jgi:membrane associated rhomboid family serine protease
LFGAWFVIARRLGVDARGVVFLIVVNLALGFVIPYIAWQAHVGGLVTGAILTAAYVYAPRRSRTATQLAATVAVLAILAVGVIIRDHQLVGTVLG